MSVRDISFASTSEHTLLPFFGRCHVGYLPSSGVVLGLSKAARLAEHFSRRVQSQQQFTQDLLSCLVEHLQPFGAAVCVVAQHLGSGPTAKVEVTTAGSGAFQATSASSMQVCFFLVSISMKLSYAVLSCTLIASAAPFLLQRPWPTSEFSAVYFLVLAVTYCTGCVLLAYSPLTSCLCLQEFLCVLRLNGCIPTTADPADAAQSVSAAQLNAPNLVGLNRVFSRNGKGGTVRLPDSVPQNCDMAEGDPALLRYCAIGHAVECILLELGEDLNRQVHTGWHFRFNSSGSMCIQPFVICGYICAIALSGLEVWLPQQSYAH